MNNFYLPIKDFEGLYAVSETGTVKSLSRTTPHGRRRKARELKPALIHDYQYVSLSKEGKKYMKRVHRLVAEAFVANPNSHPDVHHRDHDKSNNLAENLHWVTAFGNMKAAASAGRLDAQSRGYGVKLERRQVEKIRDCLQQGLPSEIVGEQFGVSGRTVRHIRSGHTWSGPCGSHT